MGCSGEPHERERATMTHVSAADVDPLERTMPDPRLLIRTHRSTVADMLTIARDLPRSAPERVYHAVRRSVTRSASKLCDDAKLRIGGSWLHGRWLTRTLLLDQRPDSAHRKRGQQCHHSEQNQRSRVTMSRIEDSPCNHRAHRESDRSEKSQDTEQCAEALRPQ